MRRQVRKLSLEFDLDENEYAAMSAIHSMDFVRALTQIRERARSTLKHGGDPLKALDDIRSLAGIALEVLE